MIADGHFSKEVWAYTFTGDPASPVVYRSGRYCGTPGQFEVLVKSGGETWAALRTFLESEVVDNKLIREVAKAGGKECPGCAAWREKCAAENS